MILLNTLTFPNKNMYQSKVELVQPRKKKASVRRHTLAALVLIQGGREPYPAAGPMTNWQDHSSPGDGSVELF